MLISSPALDSVRTELSNELIYIVDKKSSSKEKLDLDSLIKSSSPEIPQINFKIMSDGKNTF